MLRKVIITLSFSLMLTSITTVAKAEWIKDQQNKWVYYENDSSKLNYNMTENYTEPMKLPQYYQADDRWGAKRYGLSNMKLTGCVPTALAMAISGLKEDVNPVQVADFLYNMTMELNTTFFGTSSLGVQEVVSQWGLNYKVIDSKEELEETLKSGTLVYGAVGHGIFVNGYSTHAVLLTGYENGKTKVFDPDNMAKTNKWYNIDDIWKERSLAPEDNMTGGAFIAIYK